MSEIEQHGNENKKEKRRQIKLKTCFFILIWKSLEKTALSWNLYFGCNIRLCEAIEVYRYWVNGVQQRKERQT